MSSRSSAASRRGGLALFALIFALFLLRYCAFGFTYYPQQDDYIQYHNYPSSSSFLALAQAVGLLASRPLAGAADFFLWGPLFDHMILAVLILSAMYTAYVLCAAGLLGRYFRVGPVFYALACFLPLGMEGLYWVSASSRVVVGLLFGVLAAWVFAKWLDTGRPLLMALYLPLQLLPFGFYEQCGVLSVTFVLGIALLEWKRHGRRVLAALWSLAAMALYLLYTKVMANSGVYSSRAGLILPITPYYWKAFFPKIIRQLGGVFAAGGALTLFKGFWRGIPLALQRIPWLLAALACCAALALVLGRRAEREEDGRQARARFSPGWAILAGFLLALAPLSLFFVLSEGWIPMRGASMSLVGLGLMADGFFQLLLGRLRGGWRQPCALLSGVLALIFCVACLSELKDYRDTYLCDQHVAQVVIRDLSGVSPSSRVGVLGLEETYLPDQNFFYHGHIIGCTESDWALAGLLAAVRPEPGPSVSPLHTGVMYQAWNCESNRPETFDALYYYDGDSLHPLWLEQTGEHEYTVSYASGPVLGRIWEDENRNGYFELASEALA